ncbi:hypothetical protein GCM10009715_11740 [Paeniglutamicibacter psychrophenolicus]|uniref:DUF4760 domain-containing protein n=1 Tax=Paeniglutamicibacter psychrophenolicus TaxID=257454 RepID=A0ABS4W7E8_9MICC|nr:hypothetical protein [Paeniglutamicibacter psychrophenolicus]MBP2372124.1 hypothetical protein [Paeniglutamicibacter psychrophenolicus]
MSKRGPATPIEKALAWATSVLLVVNAIFWIGWINGYPPVGVDAITLGTWATAIGTFLLAYFAYHAWTTSRTTLEAMEGQAEGDLAARQKELEISALADYLRALGAAARVSEFYPGYDGEDPSALLKPKDAEKVKQDDLAREDIYVNGIDNMCKAIELSGAIWRMHHHERELEMNPFLIGEIDLIRALERQHITGFARWNLRQHCATFASGYMQLLRDWQMKPKERSQCIQGMKSISETFTSNVEGVEQAVANNEYCF